MIITSFVVIFLCMFTGPGPSSIGEESLLNLCTLAYSDNVDLQRSAALCFSEFSEKCKHYVGSESQVSVAKCVTTGSLEVL